MSASVRALAWQIGDAYKQWEDFRAYMAITYAGQLKGYFGYYSQNLDRAYLARQVDGATYNANRGVVVRAEVEWMVWLRAVNDYITQVMQYLSEQHRLLTGVGLPIGEPREGFVYPSSPYHL